MLNIFTRLKKYISEVSKWNKNSSEFRNDIDKWHKGKSAGTGITNRNAAVIVQPWLTSDVPWYVIAIGLFLSEKGVKVTFVLDDMMFGTSGRAFKLVLKNIEKALSGLADKYEVVRLSDTKINTGNKSDLQALVNRLVELNTIWFIKGETLKAGRQEYKTLIEKQLSEIAVSISAFLSNKKYDYIVVPGGIYSSSGLWYELAKRKNIRVSTFDSGGPGMLTLSVDGVASQLHDIPKAFRTLKEQKHIKKFILAEAQSEKNKREKGKDKFSSQITHCQKYDENIKDAVLMALNSPWDSAALGLHKVFEGSAQWVVETVKWILDNTKETIIIRQHPAERKKIAQSSDNYKKLLLDNFGENSRVKFIAADDPVNTYELLDQVKVVLVYTSTFGTEAATKRKIVITPSNSYDSDLGFVWKAESREGYFDLIKKALNDEIAPDDEQVDSAWYCYYLSQCCNWVVSDFSPEGFEKWGRMELRDVYNRETVQDIITAINENIPVSLLQHARKTKGM